MRPVARIPAARPRAVPAACALLLMALAGCGAADTGYKGIVPGMALGKLCHELNRGGTPVTLTLQFGDPAMVSITGTTGVCAPQPGTPCTMIPVGLVPIKLFEGDRLLTARSVTLTPPAAGAPPNEYVFQPVITTGLQVAITGGRIAPGTCQGLDFPPPDGGAKDGGGDGAVSEAGASEGGVDVGVPADAAADAGALDVPAPADAGAPDAAADVAPAADAAADASVD
jgi:hypothetical protein